VVDVGREDGAAAAGRDQRLDAVERLGGGDAVDRDAAEEEAIGAHRAATAGASAASR